ncbi:MAG: hypothetical protein K6G73_10210 [Marinilabiliaceae bacterium]|nr:hypothetical protein [Marinilabiliaceae bacterium]
MNATTQKEMKFLLNSQQGEMDAVLMYKALADKVNDAKDAETFRLLAAEEGHHAAIFKNITNQVLKPRKSLAILTLLLFNILGKRRLYRVIAKGEYAAYDKYKTIVECYPEVESVKNDEKRHGDMVMALLK